MRQRYDPVASTRKHAVNAVLLATEPRELEKFAGKGVRQGRKDAGPLLAKR